MLSLYEQIRQGLLMLVFALGFLALAYWMRFDAPIWQGVL